MASPGQAVVWGTFEPRKGGCCRFVTGTPASRNVCRVGCHFTFGRYFWRMRILDMHQSPRVVIDVNHWKRCGRPLPDTCCKKGLNWDFLPVRPGRDGAPQRGTSAERRMIRCFSLTGLQTDSRAGFPAYPLQRTCQASCIFDH